MFDKRANKVHNEMYSAMYSSIPEALINNNIDKKQYCSKNTINCKIYFLLRVAKY